MGSSEARSQRLTPTGTDTSSIRMRIQDAEWLFDHVRIGTPVSILGA
jgi:lipoprotein-anchoring transpeptidase ErfK/SrfK